MSRYLVISADCHAGLPNEQYRDWLDPSTATRSTPPGRPGPDDGAGRPGACSTRSSPHEWAHRERGGPARRLGRHPARQGARRRRRGRRGASSPTPTRCRRRRLGPVRRRPQRVGRVRDPSCAWPGPGPTTGGWPSCAPTSPDAAGRRGHRAHPRRRRRGGGRDRSGPRLGPARRHPDPVDVGARTRRTTTPATTRSGPPARSAACRCTCTRARPTRPATGPIVGMYTTEVRWWSARPLRFLIWSGVFERYPGLQASWSPSAAPSGPPTCCGRWTPSSTASTAPASWAPQLTAQLTMRPSEYFDRNCFIGASNTRRRELARRYEIGVGNIMWGNDFPHPEGTWPHTRRVPARRVLRHPVEETGGHPGDERGRGLQLRRRARWRRWPTASGPPPTSWARPTRTCPSGNPWPRPDDPGSPASTCTEGAVPGRARGHRNGGQPSDLTGPIPAVGPRSDRWPPQRWSTIRPDRRHEACRPEGQ